MSCKRRFFFWNRGVCVAKPRKRKLTFWLHAHSVKGHGIHSKLLYTLCREVFFPLKQSLHTATQNKNYAETTQILSSSLLTTITRELKGSRLPENVSPTLTLLGEHDALAPPLQHITSIKPPAIILVVSPRQNSDRWNDWCHAYETCPGVAIDLYTWGLLLLFEGIAPHRLAIRGFY